MVHPVDADDARVRREVPAGLREPLAVEHRVARPHDRERWHPAHGAVAVRADEHEAVDPIWVRVRVPARHRPAQRVPADDPRLHAVLAREDRVRLPLREHREIRSHLRDEHRHASLLDDARRRRQVRVRRHAPTRIEHHADALARTPGLRVQFLRRPQDEPAVRTLDAHVPVRTHRLRDLDRRVEPEHAEVHPESGRREHEHAEHARRDHTQPPATRPRRHPVANAIDERR